MISPNHGAEAKGSPSSHLGQDASGNRWATRALITGDVQLSDYSSWTESDHSHQMMFYPVKDSAGTVQAVIGFELQIPFEQEILTRDFSLGETGRIYQITNDGTPIVYKRTLDQPPIRTLGVSDAIVKGQSAGRRLNSQGVEVIDLYLTHDKYPWILVAEVETEEAFRELFGLETILLIGIGVTFVLAMLFSLIFATVFVRPIHELTEQMEEVSKGNLGVEIDDRGRKDEIGQLVGAFKRTVVSLKIAMDQLRHRG